ncbi:alpha/beta hydrolase [Anaerolineae bacterium AMX1]|nr:alpha/beta hydrolase [Anaerolineae bacterium AMX1]
MLSWQARTLRSLLSAKNFLSPKLGAMDVERARANLEMAGEVVRPIIHIDHIGVLANGVPGEWVIPAGTGSERVILYLHGGAYNAGSTRSHRALAANIAYAARARALTIDYRLAPEHPYPAALLDALSAYQWLLDSGIRPEQIAIAGDSAGGGLSVALLATLRERGLPMPAAAVVLSPWTDLSASGESWQENARSDYMINGPKLREAARLYLKDASPQTPLASPVYAKLEGLPPLLIQVGSDEVLLSDSLRLAENARLSGVDVTLEVWDGMQHVWQFAASPPTPNPKSNNRPNGGSSHPAGSCGCAARPPLRRRSVRWLSASGGCASQSSTARGSRRASRKRASAKDTSSPC